MSAQPEQRFEKPSSLCTTRLTPQILTGIILQWLRAHFAKAESIEEERLKTALWVGRPPDFVVEDVGSQIQIESVYRWDPRLLQHRPALIVKRSPYERMKIGIGGDRVYEPMGPGPDNLPQMGARFFVPINGGHTIFCLNHDGAAAELLSSEVFAALLQFEVVVRAEFNFMDFRVMKLGEIARFEEAYEHFAVPITLTYAYSMEWIVAPQEPRLQTVSIQAKALADP